MYVYIYIYIYVYTYVYIYSTDFRQKRKAGALTIKYCLFNILLTCESSCVRSDGQDMMSAMMQNEASNAEYINEIMAE